MRKEDERLVTGRGSFVDDIAPPGVLQVAMLRSPHAHARIVSIDASAAERMPGVLAVLTGPEAAKLAGPLRALIPTPAGARDYCMAHDRARYFGEAVAAAAATDRATAEDALELIAVEYEPLEAVVDPEVAIREDAPLLFEELGTNVLWHDTLTYGDVAGAFAGADGVLRERFAIQRYASTPLETFGCTAEYDAGTDSYTFWTNDQRPGLTMTILGESLGVPMARIRLVTPDIGGGFGNKRRPSYLIICALLAKKAGRPVTWVEDRIENLTALMQTCNQTMDLELAYRAGRDAARAEGAGRLRRGQEPVWPTQHNLIKFGNIANGYRIDAHPVRGLLGPDQQVPDRGESRDRQAVHVLRDRAGDGAAGAAAGDGPPSCDCGTSSGEEMPYTTPTGSQYDSGDYPRTLRMLLERFDYAGLAGGAGEGAGRGAAARDRDCDVGRAGRDEPGLVRAHHRDGGRRRGRPRGRWYGSSRTDRAGGDRGSAERAGVRDGDRADRGGRAEHSAGAVEVQRGFDSSVSPWLYLSGNYSNKFSVTDVGRGGRGGAEGAREAAADRGPPVGADQA